MINSMNKTGAVVASVFDLLPLYAVFGNSPSLT